MNQAAADDPGDAWRRRLGELLGSQARVDLVTRAAYAGDASIYRRVPAAIVEPRATDAVVIALAHAAEAGVPVTARGGGTSIAGNAIGNGLILDFSRHMNRVLSVDPDARTATVQPGVVLDALRPLTLPHGLAFGPDPSTHSRCTFGGMLGNNACGSHSVAWGTTADNTVSLTLVGPEGDEVAVRDVAMGEGAIGLGTGGSRRVHEELRGLIDRHGDVVRAELGRFSRQVSGYSLAHLLPEKGFNIAKAIVGSEGTCGLITEATVHLVPVPPNRALAVLGFSDVQQAADLAPELAALGALTVEGMDGELLAALAASGRRVPATALMPPGNAWLFCEAGGQTNPEAKARAQQLISAASNAQCTVVTDLGAMRELWRIREEGAGIVTRLPDGGEAWPGWEDSAVPPRRLGAYLRDLRSLLAEHGLRGVPYGHFGEGCLHLRISFALTSAAGVAVYRRFIEDAARLVASHGGSLSGEHGDGRARSELLPLMYSPQIIRAFAEFKAVFDPHARLNPGVLVHPEPFDRGLRPGPGNDRVALTVRPAHALHADGGDFGAAVRRCVGVGKCRQTDAGTMCPSFKVTRDEVHSTRGRARVLAEMMRGETIADGWRSREVLDALDLCLSCKACRNDCPVNVDMATYKAEFLYHHYRRRLRPVAHYTAGWLPLLAPVASRAPRVVNSLTGSRRAAALLKRMGGIEPRRSLPRFARSTFVDIFRKRRSPAGGPRVLLWPDTFTNYFTPEVGMDGVRVLEALGFDVEVPARPVCCGLTWHSTGQLGMARRAARRTLEILEPALRAGTTIVGLEPSCTSMLRVEVGELTGPSELAQRLTRQLRTLPDLIAEHRGEWPFENLGARAVVQPHCHQQATTGFSSDASVLERLGVRADVVSAGCCGLAGNFGYEKGHWEVAQGAAALELFPKVGAAGAESMIIADGFSCRTQITQGTGRRAVHLAQVLASALPGAG